MKKVILTIIFSFLAFVFMTGTIGCFQNGTIAPAFVSLCLMILFLYLAIRPHMKKKTKTTILQNPPKFDAPNPGASTPPSYLQPFASQNIPPAANPVYPVPSRTVSSVPLPSEDGIKEKQEDARERRRQFVEKKKAEFSSALSAIPRSEITLSDAPAVRAVLADMPEFKSRNITRATRLETLFPLVIIDIETTGINKRTSEIVEISAIKYSNGFVPVSCFTTLIKPKRPIPPEASAINNITDDMVSDAPPLSAVLDSFSEFIRGCNVAGHNLIDFDLPFLFIHGFKFSEKVNYYDTLELSKLTLKAEYDNKNDWDILNRKLETLCDYYYIYRDDAHRSLSDCYATGLVLQKLIEDKTL